MSNERRLWGGAGTPREPEPKGRAPEPPQSAPENQTVYYPAADDDDGPKYVPFDPNERHYEAFEFHKSANRLQIRTVAEGSYYPAYHYLTNVHFEHDTEKRITLLYAFMRVEITGENLGRVVHAVETHGCLRIREFHSKFYDRPAKGAPFIESITVVHLGEEDE